ncbi:MAG: class I SAM-dependent methyltransferase [Bacteroidales bacterium]
MVICPLCSNVIIDNEVKINLPSKYRYCANCELIFTVRKFWPEIVAEKERYLKHKNSINDIGYVNFLNQAISPVIELINHNSVCLDFGCGPNPTLSFLLKQQGFICDNYDPLFYPEIPDKKYDFIFATECFEHFFYPAKELQIIKSHLKDNGYLIIMTELWDSVFDFKDWWYMRDFTHVVFYHSKTFAYIATHFNFRLLQLINQKIIVLQNAV